ncbi:MAG: NUDIX domain-containing protein [Nitratireductor sp.]|nr:NUDIX domain-containing protein [Nitratireductor sp.]MCB1458421.1 NUDIX domain-containing protein [Nitratireductor sp.]
MGAGSFLRRGVHGLLLLRRALTLGVRAVIEDDAGGVLLVRHTYVKGWHFPGGGIDPGESAVDAVRREVLEEASIRITGVPELKGAYFNRRLNGRDHVLLFRCSGWEQAGTFRPNMEIAEAGFFRLDALPDDLSRGTARRIGELFDGQAVSHEW